MGNNRPKRPPYRSPPRAAIPVIPESQAVIDRWIQTSSSPPIDSLFSRLANPMKLIDEFAHRTSRKRHLSVGSMLNFLANHNVLLYAIMRFDTSRSCWVHSPTEFGRLCVTGETLLHDEVTLRLFKLFPDASLAELDALRKEALSARRLIDWFDVHQMKALFRPKASRRSRPVTDDMKIRTVYATIAELNWFVIKTKATDRTHNNALFPPSDALILHVLAAHVVECTCAGLAVEPLLPAVADAKSRWANRETSLVAQFWAEAKSSKRLDLTTMPVRRLAEAPAELSDDAEADADAVVDYVVGATDSAKAFGAVKDRPLQPELSKAPTSPLFTTTNPTLQWPRLYRRHAAHSPLLDERNFATEPLASTPSAPPSATADPNGQPASQRPSVTFTPSLRDLYALRKA